MRLIDGSTSIGNVPKLQRGEIQLTCALPDWTCVARKWNIRFARTIRLGDEINQLPFLPGRFGVIYISRWIYWKFLPEYVIKFCSVLSAHPQVKRSGYPEFFGVCSKKDLFFGELGLSFGITTTNDFIYYLLMEFIFETIILEKNMCT